MQYHIQETIFPDRHTVAVMNPSTGQFVPVAEIQFFSERNGKPVFRCDRLTPSGFSGSFYSQPSETLDDFARDVAKFYNPFERLKAADYTTDLFT